MMAYAHDADPYGHFLIDGKQPSLDNIAALVGRPLKEIKGALSELEHHGVFSRRDDGAIYSRRMVRDHERSEEGRKQVGKRWANRSNTNEPNRSEAKEPNSYPIRSNGHDPTTEKLEVRNSEAYASSTLALEDPLGLEEPQKEQATGRKRKNKTPLPKNFAADREFARQLSWSERRIDEQIRAFFDSALAHNRQYADWQAAWRNWCTSPFQKPVEANGHAPTANPDDQKAVWKMQWDFWLKHHRWTGSGPDPESSGCHIPQELREEWSQQQ